MYQKTFIRALLISFFLVALIPSCKKAVDNVQENVLYDIITNGKWKVTRFDVGPDPRVAEYSEFEFQFLRNGVVSAIKTGNPNINGTWVGYTENLSILSNFPGVGDPLQRFNGTWFITKTTETTVDAFRSVGAVTYTLGLKKI